MGCRKAMYCDLLSIYRSSYNKTVKIKGFNVGVLVWRKVLSNTKLTGAGKLAHVWEGPYQIDKVPIF